MQKLFIFCDTQKIPRSNQFQSFGFNEFKPKSFDLMIIVLANKGILMANNKRAEVEKLAENLCEVSQYVEIDAPDGMPINTN